MNLNKLRMRAKKCLLPNVLLATGFAGAHVSAQQTFQIVEVEVSNAFIAPKGFDSNDDVLVVVEGTFPNQCYFKGNTDVHKDYDAHKIVIRQFAKVEHEGVCADHANLNPELAKPKAFMAELYMGTMAPYANYKVEYLGPNQTIMTKEFLVEKASVEHVDSMRYAILENAFAKNEVKTSEKTMEIRITGYLNSSCAKIVDDPENKDIIVYDDVIVVLLKVVTEGEFCIPMNNSFYKIRTIDVPKAGRYLLHARSQGGEAKNKLFTVIDDTEKKLK